MLSYAQLLICGPKISLSPSARTNDTPNSPIYVAALFQRTRKEKRTSPQYTERVKCAFSYYGLWLLPGDGGAATHEAGEGAGYRAADLRQRGGKRGVGGSRGYLEEPGVVAAGGGQLSQDRGGHRERLLPGGGRQMK